MKITTLHVFAPPLEPASHSKLVGIVRADTKDALAYTFVCEICFLGDGETFGGGADTAALAVGFLSDHLHQRHADTPG